MKLIPIFLAFFSVNAFAQTKAFLWRVETRNITTSEVKHYSPSEKPIRIPVPGKPSCLISEVYKDEDDESYREARDIACKIQDVWISTDATCLDDKKRNLRDRIQVGSLKLETQGGNMRIRLICEK